MPITKSAKKTLRKEHRRTVINKTWQKRVKQAIKELKKKPTVKAYALAASLIDKVAKKKIIHKNKASRLKSRLSKLLAKPRSKTQKSPAKKVRQIKKTIKKRVNN